MVDSADRKTFLGKRLQKRSISGVLLTLLVLVSVVFIGSRLTPVYLDDNTTVTVMEKMIWEKDLALQQDAKIREIMRKRLKINNSRKFDLKNHLKIVRGLYETELLANYEIPIELIANLELIAVFENKVLLKS
jgi:hypothetical protein